MIHPIYFSMQDTQSLSCPNLSKAHFLPLLVGQYTMPIQTTEKSIIGTMITLNLTLDHGELGQHAGELME